MSEKPTPSPSHPLVVLLAGVGTFSFLAWLCWATTKIIDAGIPEADRAELVASMVIAAVGLLISAVIAARAVTTNPLEFTMQLYSAVRSIWRKK